MDPQQFFSPDKLVAPFHCAGVRIAQNLEQMITLLKKVLAVCHSDVD